MSEVGIINNRAGMIVSSQARVTLAPGKNVVRKQAADALLSDPVIKKLIQAGIVAVVDAPAAVKPVTDEPAKRGPGRPRKVDRVVE